MKTGGLSRVIDNTLAAEDDPDLLAAWKELLGELINSAARLRFFPHRVMMFITLAELTENPAERTSFMASAKTTLEQFQRIVAGLTTDPSVFEVKPELQGWLAALMRVDRASFDQVSSTFLLQVADLQKNMQAGRGDRKDMIRLATFVATELFARMNKVVSDFAEELTRVAQREKNAVEVANRKKQNATRSNSSIVAITDELNRVGSTIHMISVNTMVQAARSGEDGKTFGVIAQEIQKLSAEMRDLTSRIVSAIQGAGI